MVTNNLNYFYYVEYFDDTEMIFNADSDVTQSKLQRKNGELADYSASACELMQPFDENVAPNCFELWTSYPGLLIGTGLPHSFGGKGEAALGLTFDYVTGMPYIPSSSVKGALRSAFVHEEYIRSLLETEKVTEYDKINISELETHIFGNPADKKKTQFDVSLHEQDIFYDAVVVSEGKILATDSITPHRTNPELLELAAPNPITMIRIRPDVKFRFQFCLKESCGVTPEQKLRIFMKILLDLGIGAKTNVGYGSFVDPFACPLCGEKKVLTILPVKNVPPDEHII